MRVFQLIFVIICALVLSLSLVKGTRLQEKYIWKQLTFAWPSNEEEQNAIASGRYIPVNCMPLGIELWGDKVFVTVPRWRSGIPVSLAYIQLPTDEMSPVLHPYPDWESHQIESIETERDVQKRNIKCGDNENILAEESKTVENSLSSKIVSPFRVKVDECDRLWILDSGVDGILKMPPVKVTPPTIIIMALKTDKVIHRYEFPADHVLKSSSFPYITVDISEGDCDNAFAYIPDVTGFGLIVYSLKEDRSWRIKHNYFHFDPLEGNIFTGGINYQVPDGIFAVAIGNLKPDKSKDVYFHPLSSTKEFIVSNKVLQNETRVLEKEAYYDFKLLGDRGFNGQATAEIFDKNTEIMFYSQINKDAVGCWNSRKPYTPDTQGLIDSDSTSLNFVNSFFVDKGDNLWVLSNRLGNYVFSKDGLNASDDNFRILGGRIAELIIGTPCDFVDDSFYLQYPDL